MNLANGEKLLREWTYATKKEGRTKSKCTLTVTNKRIVASEDSTLRITQEEIPMKAVKTISFSHEIMPKLLSMILFCVAGALLLVGVYLAAKQESAKPFFIFIICAAIVSYIAYTLLNQSKFYMTITTEGGEGSRLSIGANTVVRKRKMKNKVKVKISDSVILEIIDDLGALVINCQEGNT